MTLKTKSKNKAPRGVNEEIRKKNYYISELKHLPPFMISKVITQNTPTQKCSSCATQKFYTITPHKDAEN